MAHATVTVVLQDLSEVRQIVSAARAVTKAWDALLDYHADLFPCCPEKGQACQDALDKAISELKVASRMAI